MPGPIAPRPIARATARVLIEPVMMKTSLLGQSLLKLLIYAIAAKSAASSKRHTNKLLVAGNCLFTLSLNVVFNFCLRFVFGRGRHLQEDQRQQREDQGLHESHKNLKRDENNVRQGGYQECEHSQYRAAREDVAEKTESERKDA